SSTPTTITSGQLSSNPRQRQGAWRSSIKPSVISQALPKATASTAPANVRDIPALPSTTVPTERAASPTQHRIRVIDVDITASSAQHVNQRKQQHPDQINHVPIQHARLQPAAIVRRIGAQPATVGHVAEDQHAQQHVQEMKPGENPVQGEKGVVLQIQT